jgi:hypothetical protein
MITQGIKNIVNDNQTSLSNQSLSMNNNNNETHHPHLRHPPERPISPDMRDKYVHP